MKHREGETIFALELYLLHISYCIPCTVQYSTVFMVGIAEPLPYMWTVIITIVDSDEGLDSMRYSCDR